MKPAPFRLHRPTTVAEATAVFAEFGDEAKVLAGGQSLVPLLALRLTRFEHLVDLNGVTELRGIEREDGALRVGAMVRQAEAEHSDDVAASAPLLHRAVPYIGHFQIRNRGTVGGSTVHADPASELPAVAMALDAEMEVTGRTGVRTIAARDFFQSMWTTAVEVDEILTAIRYPVWESRCGFAVEEFARRSGDFAIAGVACGVALAPQGTIARCRDRTVRHGHDTAQGGRGRVCTPRVDCGERRPPCRGCGRPRRRPTRATTSTERPRFVDGWRRT